MSVKKEQKGEKYRGVDLGKIRGLTPKTQRGAGGSSPFFKIVDVGVPHRIRVLPAVGNMEGPIISQVSHYDRCHGENRGFEVDGYRRAITCLEAHEEGGKCPVCFLANEAEEMGFSKIAEQLRPSEQFMANVQVRGGQGGVVPWGFSAGVLKQIQGIAEDKDIVDPSAGGYDLIVTKVTTGNKRFPFKYQVEAAPKPSATTPGWEGEATDLSETVRLLSREEIETVLIENLSDVIPVGKIFGRGAKASPVKVKTTQRRK